MDAISPGLRVDLQLPVRYSSGPRDNARIQSAPGSSVRTGLSKSGARPDNRRANMAPTTAWCGSRNGDVSHKDLARKSRGVCKGIRVCGNCCQWPGVWWEIQLDCSLAWCPYGRLHLLSAVQATWRSLLIRSSGRSISRSLQPNTTRASSFWCFYLFLGAQQSL
jgi:hypothetical protein